MLDLSDDSSRTRFDTLSEKLQDLDPALHETNVPRDMTLF